MRENRFPVMSDHFDKYSWTISARHIRFTDDEGLVKFYTIHPKNARTDREDIIKIALVLEPRDLSGTEYLYKYVEDNYLEFDYIFTHDDKLLELPNAVLFLWCDIWAFDNRIKKSKNISLVCSSKEYCKLHTERLKLARQFKGSDKVDTYGTFDGGKYTSCLATHAPYKFAIAIENSHQQYWYTEKLLNCFANKTVPIYYGATSIGDLFDSAGIIVADSVDDIPYIVDSLYINGIDDEYNRRKDAIDGNFIQAMNYLDTFGDRLVSKYMFYLTTPNKEIREMRDADRQYAVYN